MHIPHNALQKQELNFQVTQPYDLLTLLVANDAIVSVLQPRPCLHFGMKGETEEQAGRVKCSGEGMKWDWTFIFNPFAQ